MAEECGDPTIKLPRAISLCVPVGGIAGLFFVGLFHTFPSNHIHASSCPTSTPSIPNPNFYSHSNPLQVIPLCATLPPLEDVLAAPAGQALPYIYGVVMESPGGGLGLTFLVLMITLFCSISITVAASRTTWAFARDDALPFARLWSRVDTKHGTPIWALLLTTLVQMALGLINLGSSSAFLAFVSVGVMALAVSYAIPIVISLVYARREVALARWNLGHAVAVNVVAVAWIVFEVVLFSMPTALPVTEVTMNYASVVFVGFGALSAAWYAVWARKVYKGPPESDGLTA